MKSGIIMAAALMALSLTANSQNMGNQNTDVSFAPFEQLDITFEWDKTFPKSDQVEHRKVTFMNRYGITLVADMYRPKEGRGSSPKNPSLGNMLPAIAVCGPFGAVKEQSSGLYAQQLAERGFLTIAFDPSFTGESGGMPRRVASPDINTERIFLLPSTSCQYSQVWMPIVSAFSGYADGAVLQSMLPQTIPVSRPLWLPRCTI
jgi:Hydrolases of the alpha/beta superfamily